MILALDVYYRGDSATAIGVVFDWTDDKPRQVISAALTSVAGYIPGQFYKRELPCLLGITAQVDLGQIKAIIIDGYVYVDNALSPGLGAYLYEALGSRIPVIGAAKTAFCQNQETVTPVCRGASQSPLYVSAIGMEMEQAALHITEMQGKFRMPTILRELDRLTRVV
jgi:deoxyribonuclease V